LLFHKEKINCTIVDYGTPKLNRNFIGYEINEKFLITIKEKLGFQEGLFQLSDSIEIQKRIDKIEIEKIDYIPRIKDAKPIIEPKKLNFKNGGLYRVVEIINCSTIKLNTGLIVNLLGVEVTQEEEAMNYLQKYLLKKEVLLKFDKKCTICEDPVSAYVYLKNKIFINSFLIKSGIAKADRVKQYDYKNKFIGLEIEAS
jgi:hypothetical protein